MYPGNTKNTLQVQTRRDGSVFLCKNGRLYAENISFILPNGLYLDTNPECSSEWSIHFILPDASVSVGFHLETASFSTIQELQRAIMDCGNHPISEPLPTILNNIEGHYAMYRSETYEYFELCLDAKNLSAPHNRFTVLITDASKSGIQTTIQHEAICTAIKSIRKLQ